MEPSVHSIDDALRLLAEAKEVAEPIRRADPNYNFSVHQLVEAHGKAAKAAAFTTKLVSESLFPYEHTHFGVFSMATSYLNILTKALLDAGDNVSAEIKQLLEYFDVVPRVIADQFSRAPIDA